MGTSRHQPMVTESGKELGITSRQIYSSWTHTHGLAPSFMLGLISPEVCLGTLSKAHIYQLERT